MRGSRAVQFAAACAVLALLCGCSIFGGSGPEPVPLPPAGTAGATAADPAGDPALATFYDQELSWTECDGIECAELIVPLDWSDPDGETFEIALGRDRASGERLGSLVYNPGGPGVGGVEYVRAANRIAGADVREHFDFVGFDPRGTGGSGPIDCVTDRQLDHYLAGDASPDDADELAGQAADNREFGEGCVERSSPRVGHVDTLSVVRDLDVLRAALGEE